MRRFLIFIAAVILLASPMTSLAGKLVIITIGGASLDKVTSPGLPNISRLIQRGAVGVMNVRPAKKLSGVGNSQISGYSMAGSCATIGAGTRVGVTTEASAACSRSEMINRRSAVELYTSLYGRSPGSAQVLHLGMNSLRFINEEAKYPVELGALGDALHAGGIKTAVVGNSDTPANQGREAALIVSDSQGIIDFGNVGAGLIERDPATIRPTALGRRFLNDLQALFLVERPAHPQRPR